MLSVLDSDKRLADHFGGKVSSGVLIRGGADSSCTWDTTRSGTCLPSLRRNE